MLLKPLTVFLILILCSFNDSFSNIRLKDSTRIKLPNTLMYELIDCANNTNSLNDYMERYLLYPVKDKHLVQFHNLWEEQRAMAADSANRILLTQIVDSLKIYAIKRTDLVTEHFSWVYKEYSNGTIHRSGSNRFEFKKGENVFSVTFKELAATTNGWRIIEAVTFKRSNASAKQQTINVSSTLAVDPVKLGQRLAEIIQAGKLEELFKYFPTEKNLAPVYKDNIKKMQGVLADNEETKNIIRQRFYRLKPGSYKVHNEYMHMTRNSDMPGDMDKGYYQFALTHENSTKRFNLKYIIANEKIYVWDFTEYDY